MPFVPPEELHEYRLLRLLGRGAMGSVWLGHDTVLDRPVAIKFVDGVGDDPAARERFLIEARAIARLSHPNVAAIHRVGEWAGQPFLVTEYVAGRSLAELPLPLPPERVVRIGLDLARGLSAAHRRGVVHRDVKPANAQCDEDGAVKLVDFGIARIVDELPRPAPARNAPLRAPSGGDLQATLPPVSAAAAPAPAAPAPAAPASPADRAASAPPGPLAATPSRRTPESLTATGALVGTPRYMAPEVWRGEQATPRSDVWSAGAVLYELASGHPPHAAASLAELRERVTGRDAPPLLEAAPAAGAPLATVVDRCLRRDPEARYAAGDQLALALLELQRSAAGPAPGGVAQTPYRGLAPFEAEHRQLFFGRAEELGALLELVRAEPLAVVAGDSGAGKSSLCRAGLLPLLEEGALGEGLRWRTAALYPGRAPLAALHAALAPWLQRLRGRPELLQQPDQLAAAIALRAAEGEGLVLLVDQLEELVTQAEPLQAAQAARLLARLAVRTPGLRVVAAVRGDFLTRLAAFPELAAVLTRGLVLLGPLTPAGLREAICGPARSAGVAFETEALVDELAASAAGAEGSLPLLQFALSRLWDLRDAGRGIIPAAALEAIGGVAGALARHGDAALERLLPEGRKAARRMLTGLVTAEGTRARRASAELATRPGDAAVLEALVQARLLTARPSDDGTTYELAHEALLRGWGTLRGWLASDGEKRLLAARVEQGAAEWARHAQAADLLWRGPQLAEARALAGAEVELSQRAAGFLRASRRGERRRRIGRWAATLGLPGLVAIAIGGVIVSQRLARDREASDRIRAAKAATELALADDARVEELLKRAFAAFDDRRIAQAEALYAEAGAAAAQMRKSFGRAERELEAALLLQARAAKVRAAFARLIHKEIVAAERWPAAAPPGLLDRLATFDEEGSLRRALDAPARLSVSSSPPGARLRVQRYVRQGDRLALAAADEAGRSPWDGALQPGSYLLTLELPDRPPVRAPVRLQRGESLQLSLEIPEASRIPEGMIYVPPGRFLYGWGGDEAYRDYLHTVQPMHPVRTGAYLIGRNEVTFAQWIEFLRSLPPAERKARLPAVSGGLHRELRLEEVPIRGGGPPSFRLMLRPTEKAFIVAEGQRVRYPDRALRAEQDWLRFPVTAVSFADAAAYLAWLDRSGKVPGARLCTEHEWERAARGADERNYPHGDALLPDDINIDLTYGRKPLAFGPDEVGSHPISDSPFGVQDLSGNAWEMTASVAAPAEFVYRGGGWYERIQDAISCNRELGEATMRDLLLGLRVCAAWR